MTNQQSSSEGQSAPSNTSTHQPSQTRPRSPDLAREHIRNADMAQASQPRHDLTQATAAQHNRAEGEQSKQETRHTLHAREARRSTERTTTGHLTRAENTPAMLTRQAPSFPPHSRCRPPQPQPPPGPSQWTITYEPHLIRTLCTQPATPTEKRKAPTRCPGRSHEEKSPQIFQRSS